MNIVEFARHPQFLASAFAGDSWDNWWAILRGAFGLRDEMTQAELLMFTTLTERAPPAHQVSELYIDGGRGCGKDSVASLIACYVAVNVDFSGRLRPGEKATILCLACDREQAKIVKNYTVAYFTENPLLKGMIARETKDGIELTNNVEIIIGTSDYRQVRGKTIVLAILDEVAFWPNENAASPDIEVYNALGPALGRIPGSLMVIISTPYARRGLLYVKFKAHWGVPSEDVLFVKATTKQLNPLFSQAIIDAKMASDPAAAMAEYYAEFRSDFDSFVSLEAVEACVIRGRHELMRVAGRSYVAFVDPSGGSGSDSMTLCVAHAEHRGRQVLGDDPLQDRVAVVDALIEARPTFDPETVCVEFAEVLKRYGITKVRGDKYGGDWPSSRFNSLGIAYEASETTRSQIYAEFLPLLNSQRVELPDNARLIAQFAGLERRVGRGADAIDHAPGAHDDLSNVVAGASVMVAGTPDAVEIMNRAGETHAFRTFAARLGFA